MGEAFEAVAAELLRGPLETFVARRKAASTGALKAQVAKLPKPSAAAHALDAYAHEHPRELAALLDTGHALREAQDAGDAQRIRELVQRAGEQVQQLMTDVGTGLGSSARTQVEQTLRAALSDPAAADALQAGLLVTALSPAGFGSVDLDGAVAGRPPVRDVQPVHAGDSQDEQVRRRAAEEAERARVEGQRAERALRAAEADLERREHRLAEAQGDRDRLAAALAEADAAVGRARAEREEAVQRRDAAAAARDAAAAARDAAACRDSG